MSEASFLVSSMALIFYTISIYNNGISGRTSCRKCFHVILNIRSIQLAIQRWCIFHGTERYGTERNAGLFTGKKAPRSSVMQH